MIVDAWMQCPNRRILAEPMFESIRRWTGMVDASVEIPVELTVKAMDDAKVSIGVICAWEGPQGTLISNDEVAATVARFPERFVGLASVDIRRPMDAVRELRRSVNDLGLIGLRVLPWLWDLPPNHRLMYPLYAECVQLGIPFCLQVGHTGPLCPSEWGRPIPYLDRVALDFPELTIVAGHIGYPWTNEMIALADKYENVHIDTSAYKPKRYPQELVAWMKSRGRHKVLFGSNWPMLAPAACLEQLDVLGLDDETRDLFLAGNAKRVFGLA